MWIWSKALCEEILTDSIRLLTCSNWNSEIKWISRVASMDEFDTEVKFVAVVQNKDDFMVVRVTSEAEEILRNRIQFQERLRGTGIHTPIPALNICSIRPNGMHWKNEVERNGINPGMNPPVLCAYMEEWVEGVSVSGNDFYTYAKNLGRLHATAKKIGFGLMVERNHVLYDVQRFDSEIKNCDSCQQEKLLIIKKKTIELMIQLKEQMLKNKRYPVHGDYCGNNLIKRNGTLYLIDFERAGMGFLPEEAGEAFADAQENLLGSRHADMHLEEFLSIYGRFAETTENELLLTRCASVISLIIRTLCTVSITNESLEQCEAILRIAYRTI